MDPNSRVEDIIRGLRGTRFDSLALIAVCEGQRLVGVITLENLFAASEDATAAELMDSTPPTSLPSEDQEIAAYRASQRGESAVAVVDVDGRFLGLVPPQSLIAVLLEEHEEDMARLGGFVHEASTAREAASEPVARRYRHRLPWLLIGLAGALGAAFIISFFEENLRRKVLLAFFLPGIVYLADAVGTQTETLIIRGLSVGVSIRQVVRRELITGVLVGLTVSIGFLPVAALLWRDIQVALSVSIALLAASSTATGVAMLLPWLLHRRGKDPAYGSGPLATVFQDLLSIAIYFLVASVLIP